MVNALRPRWALVFGMLMACGGPQKVGASGATCFRDDDCAYGYVCAAPPGSTTRACTMDVSGIVSSAGATAVSVAGASQGGAAGVGGSAGANAGGANAGGAAGAASGGASAGAANLAGSAGVAGNAPTAGTGGA